MEITIVRTGGIAGMRAQLGPVETGQLGDAGARIAAQIEEVGFFELSSELPGGPPIPDGFHYAVKVEDGKRRHSVSYGDETERQACEPLVEIQQLLIANGVDFEWGVRIERKELRDDDGGFAWCAWRNRMPGINDPDLHVAGSCEFGSSSVELTLEPGNEGVIDDPELFVLELTISRPQIGDDKMSEEYALWTSDVGPDVKRVRVQGDAQTEFDVIEAV